MLHKLLRPSLFRRLLGWQALVLLSVLFLNLGWNLWQTYRLGDGAIDQELSLRAEGLARFTAINPTPGQAAAVAKEVLALVTAAPGFVVSERDFGWQIWTREGLLLSRDAVAGGFALSAPGSLPVGQRRDVGDWRLMAARSPDGSIWTVVGQSRAVYQQLDRLAAIQMVLIPLVFLVILMLALWLASWRGLRPLHRLSERIAARAPGDMQPMANPAADPVELQPIVAALDGYAQREAALRATEQRLFSDAAHELRTPLAVIGAQAHVLSQETDAVCQRQALHALQASVQRGAEVLAKVLTLSRLDAGAACPNPTRLELLADCVTEQAPRALQSGHDLGLSEGPPLWVSAETELLRNAVGNLIDNALRHCPAGCQITVSWGSQQDGVWCAVEDDGPGIPVADRERIFQRFERGATAAHVVGSGLGLAITQAVAARLNGVLELASPAWGSGCRFVLRWPTEGQNKPG